MKRILAAVLGMLVVSAWLCPENLRAAETKSTESRPIPVVDRRTYLRTFSVFRTPAVLGKDGEFKRPYRPEQHGGKVRKHWIPEYQSPMPEEDWRSVTFDDSEWGRNRAPIEKYRGQISGRDIGALHHATPNSIICARAKFLVDDPRKTQNLTLSLKYVGGVAVFVNGKELTRQHLPEGELKPDTLATKYPDDFYVTPDGKYVLQIQKRQSKEEKERFQERYRYLRDIAIPASMLRKGMNVVALQLHRAPVNEAATLATRRHYSGMYRVPGLWAYVALRDLEITAPDDAAVQPNVARPTGIQVWNCAPHSTVSINSYGDPGDPGAPIDIDAVRNGAFYGRFVISATKTIKNLDVSMSALKQKDGEGELSGEAAALRHGRRSRPSETQRHGHLFDGLWNGVPDAVPLFKKRLRLAHRKYVNCNGAVMPVWITVRPPKNAPAGLYEGTVTVQADALDTIKIPVRCTVHDWTLPDPIDYRVKQLNVFSPYSLALHYDVPLWSDRHI